MSKLQQLLKSLDDTLAKFGTVQTGEKGSILPALEAELASRRREILEFAQKDIDEATKKQFQEEMISSGKFLTKEKADAEILSAQKKAEEDFNAKLQVAAVRQKRIEKCVENNIPLDTVFEGIKTTDGRDMTFKDKLELIPVDQTGDQIFQMDLQAWIAALKEDEKKETQQTTQQTQLQEAASKRRVIPIAGSGGSGNSTQQNKEVANVPKHLLGKRKLSAAK